MVLVARMLPTTSQSDAYARVCAFVSLVVGIPVFGGNKTCFPHETCFLVTWRFELEDFFSVASFRSFQLTTHVSPLATHSHLARAPSPDV